MKTLLGLFFLFVALKVFAQEEDAENFQIKAVERIDSDHHIELLQPHVQLNGVHYRFSQDKRTFEGLCHLLVEKGASVEISSSDFSSKGTLFLKSNGKLLNKAPIFRSLQFLICYK